MNRPTLSLLLIISIAYLSSCSTKINTDAPYKNVTLVYGLFDAIDTAHYVRIQKTFLDQNQVSFAMAKISDSSFYLDLEVSVKEINPADGSVHNTFSLTKVNLADEGFPKDTGIFFTAPSYAYKFKQHLSPSYWYRLMIRNPKTGEVDSAQTPILNEDSASDHGFRIPLFYHQDAISLGQGVINPYVDFFIDGYAPDSTKIMDGIFRFHWIDRDINTGVETDRSYDWVLPEIVLPAPATSNNSSFSFFLQNLDFVNTLRAAMGPAPANIIRFLDSSDIFINAGTEELYKYQVSGSAFVGLLANDAHPIFSNISGNNVYGIFTSRGRRSHYNLAFDRFAFDFITKHPLLDSMALQSKRADH